jgi:hypothetical protein
VEPAPIEAIRSAPFFQRGQDPQMESCGRPLADMALREAGQCAWDIGSKALSHVFQSPGSATIPDWGRAILAALILLLLNLLLLILGLLVPRRLLNMRLPLPETPLRDLGATN